MFTAQGRGCSELWFFRLRLEARDTGEKLGLGLLGSPPSVELHPFACFQILVVLEEMRDLGEQRFG